MIYGFLNITIYLGLYVIAMQNITAGIGALAIASNPVFISSLSVFFKKETALFHYNFYHGLHGWSCLRFVAFTWQCNSKR